MPVPPPRRPLECVVPLGAARPAARQVTVVIVVMLLATALSLRGLPTSQVLAVLTGAGLLAFRTVGTGSVRRRPAE